MKFHLLELISKLHNNYRKVFSINDKNLMLIQVSNKLFLLESYCPHAGYPMLDAKLIGSDLRCPMHGYLFNIENGECTLAIEGPCRGLTTYKIVYKGEDVGVEL